jgi:hypothetical protein
LFFVFLADYAQASYRVYEKQTKLLKLDQKTYDKTTAGWDDEHHVLSYGQDSRVRIGVVGLLGGFFPHFFYIKKTPRRCDSRSCPVQVSAEGAERLSAAIREKEQKRKSFSRRRAHNADADIDYINDRNAKFNKKLGMFVWVDGCFANCCQSVMTFYLPLA